jgi:hypothetical protein
VDYKSGREARNSDSRHADGLRTISIPFLGYHLTSLSRVVQLDMDEPGRALEYWRDEGLGHRATGSNGAGPPCASEPQRVTS